MTKRVYVNPNGEYAEAFVAALITHPAKFEIVETRSEAEIDAAAMMPSGTLASWTTSYFVADAEINQHDLTNKTIEISIERSDALDVDERLSEIEAVLAALGIPRLEYLATTKTGLSAMVAGFYKGSSVSVAHRHALRSELRITITDPKLQVTLLAPLGGTAMTAEISGHSADGTTKLRPLYRSAISRWLANY